MAIHNRRDMILLGIIVCGVKSIHIIRKWFGISIKRYILIKGMMVLVAIHNRRDMILLGIIICGVKSIHIICKWFGISIFYYIKQYILIKGMMVLPSQHLEC